MRTIRIALIALVLALLTAPIGPAFAGTDPPSEVDEGGLAMTGYTVYKGGSVHTGQIYKASVITVDVWVFDSRITKGKPQPNAVMNTASFVNQSQGNITYSDVKVGAKGSSYRITLANLIYSGMGNTFLFDVSYSGVSPPLPITPVEFALKQCVDDTMIKDDEDEDKPDGAVKETGFVLKDAHYGPGGGEPIYAGEPFTLRAVIMATNGTYAVENVSVSFSPPEQLTFADGSSVSYIGNMAPGASASVNATLMPGANIQEGSYTVAIDVSGVNQKTGAAVSGSMTVSIPILQPERFEIFNTQLPTDLTAGTDDGMGYSSITLVNMGRGAVANVFIEIKGDGLYTEEGRQYIGNVGGGEQKSADFILHADTSGLIDALVIVSYENIRGEKKTLDHSFTVNVMEFYMPEITDPGFPGDPDWEEGGQSVRKGLPTWLLIAIGAGAAIAVIAILVHGRKKRLAAAEAALDDKADDEEE